jgi:hypothetical protein
MELEISRISSIFEISQETSDKDNLLNNILNRIFDHYEISIDEKEAYISELLSTVC